MEFVCFLLLFFLFSGLWYLYLFYTNEHYDFHCMRLLNKATKKTYKGYYDTHYEYHVFLREKYKQRFFREEDDEEFGSD